MSEPVVRLLDYGLGNLRSVARALEAAGARVSVSAEVGEERLVIPGVGAFPEGARRLRLGDRWDAVRSHLAQGRPLLGICLGMQLLFSRSFEHGTTPGLAAFEGDVIALEPPPTVPNMGWHRLQGLGNPYVYFAHSYGVAASEHAVATLDHGRRWVAAVQRDAIWGFQFHPEKSGPAGIALLRSWLRC
jgi:imidazole glycerol-phosphate synthase subunit HisH